VRIGQGGQGRQELVAFRRGADMRFHVSEISDACQRVNLLFHGGSPPPAPSPKWSSFADLWDYVTAGGLWSRAQIRVRPYLMSTGRVVRTLSEP
jgi:hypothetical protein